MDAGPTWEWRLLLLGMESPTTQQEPPRTGLPMRGASDWGLNGLSEPKLADGLAALLERVWRLELGIDANLDHNECNRWSRR